MTNAAFPYTGYYTDIEILCQLSPEILDTSIDEHDFKSYPDFSSMGALDRVDAILKKSPGIKLTLSKDEVSVESIDFDYIIHLMETNYLGIDQIELEDLINLAEGFSEELQACIVERLPEVINDKLVEKGRRTGDYKIATGIILWMSFTKLLNQLGFDNKFYLDRESILKLQKGLSGKVGMIEKGIESAQNEREEMLSQRRNGVFPTMVH